MAKRATRFFGPGRRPVTPSPSRGRGLAALLYGINSVEQALLAGRRRILRLYLKSGPLSGRLARIRELAARAGLTPELLSAPGLDMLCGSPHHQGAAMECGALPAGDEESALARATAPDTFMVALDQVEDPQNLGAVVRNCAIFGAKGLAVPRRHSAPFSPAASKASAGLLESFPLYEIANLPRFLDRCRERRVWVAGTDAAGETPLPRFDPPRPLLLVLGNEGRGMRPLVRSKCDFVISIPTAAGGSLNIASASAILLYALTQSR
jgi:23S rRNA (guanosine2251-2'-O)-methyltransferase